MAKGIREKIKLVSTAGTGHYYTTNKNNSYQPLSFDRSGTLLLFGCL